MNIPNENYNENDFKEPKRKPKKSRAFYIALTICIAAVSAAAWSTYESVKNFITPSKSGSSSSLKSAGHGVGQKDASKSSILEENSEDKANHSTHKLIPYDHPSAKAAPKEDSSEEIQAVSAQKSDLLVVYPTGNNITKEFSDGKPVYSKTMNDWRIHSGADFKAEAGSKVKSITGGTVKDIYNDPVYGTTIVVEHDPKFTAYYCGLGETALVKKDDRVQSGQEIGSIHKVPCEVTEEPHLHLMIHKDDKFIDPLLILEKESQ